MGRCRAPPGRMARGSCRVTRPSTAGRRGVERRHSPLTPVVPAGAHMNRVRPFGGRNFIAALSCSARPGATQSCFAGVPAQYVPVLGVRTFGSHPARPFIASRPAPLESPGFAVPGEPARRGRWSAGPSSCSASPLAGRSRLVFSPLTHWTFLCFRLTSRMGGGSYRWRVWGRDGIVIRRVTAIIA